MKNFRKISNENSRAWAKTVLSNLNHDFCHIIDFKIIRHLPPTCTDPNFFSKPMTSWQMYKIEKKSNITMLIWIAYGLNRHARPVIKCRLNQVWTPVIHSIMWHLEVIKCTINSLLLGQERSKVLRWILSCNDALSPILFQWISWKPSHGKHILTTFIQSPSPILYF